MLARYSSALPAGALATLALLYLMQGLIALMPGAASEARDRSRVDWVRPLTEKAPAELPHRVVDPRLLTNAPTPPATRPALPGGDGMRIDVPTFVPGPAMQNPDAIGTPDGPLIAIVRVQPGYPAIAEQRGLEGWVDVRFDVLPNGLTSGVAVIASSHALFEKAAIQAARRFRFKAPVVDGIPRSSRDIEYRFRFKITD